MEPEKNTKEQRVAELSKKYNLQAMQNYNFEHIDFDIDFGSISKN